MYIFSYPLSHQVVAAGVVDHPALFHHGGALPFRVLDGLNHAHQRDVTAGGWAEHGQGHEHTRIMTNANIVVP